MNTEINITTQAQSAYNAIPTRLALTADQQQDYANFSTIVSVLSAQSMYELDNSAQQTLLGVTQEPKGFAMQTAKGILQLYGYVFASSECSLPECCGALRTPLQSIVNDQSVVVANGIRVYPNPAKDKVVFDFSQLGRHLSGFVTVHDVTGKQLWREVISAESQQAVWFTGKTSSGLYFYTVSVNDQAFTSGKIFISH